MASRFADIFGAVKPVIAMAHLPALPGAPLHDAATGMGGVVDAVARDLEILLGEEDLEMLDEELEFYGWLEAQPEFANADSVG